MPYQVEKDSYVISDDPSLLNISFIHNFLSNESYWAKNITLNIANQIGFARLVTDKATFAYLADVFIIAAYRGYGLSKWLIETIHAHPELQTLRRWMLGTRYAHELYKKFGWTHLPEPERFMQKHNANAYKLK